MHMVKYRELRSQSTQKKACRFPLCQERGSADGGSSKSSASRVLFPNARPLLFFSSLITVFLPLPSQRGEKLLMKQWEK